MMRETFAFKLLFAAEVSYVICMNMFRKLMWLRGIYIFMYNNVLESYAISSRIFDYWLRIYELHSDGGDMGQRSGLGGSCVIWQLWRYQEWLPGWWGWSDAIRWKMLYYNQNTQICEGKLLMMNFLEWTCSISIHT